MARRKGYTKATKTQLAQIKSMQDQGISENKIAKYIGLDNRTIGDYLANPTLFGHGRSLGSAFTDAALSSVPGRRGGAYGPGRGSTAGGDSRRGSHRPPAVARQNVPHSPRHPSG